MPLQIRRGTNAERLAMSQPLASGELLYTTDTQRIYVGNGATLGGVAVTGYTNDDAQDAAAAIFTGGSHTGINFSYNTITNLINATVDLSDYNGVLNAAALKGSIFADDSSLMIDTIENKIYASAGFFGTLTGSVTGNTSGTHTGPVSGNVTGNVTGDVTGDTFGYHTGDVKGSVVAADSTILVDAVDGKIVGPVFADVTGKILAPNASVVVDNTTKVANLTSINLSSPSTINGNPIVLTTTGASIVSQADGTDLTIPTLNVGCFISSATYGPQILVQKSRGSVISQTIVQNGDIISSWINSGYDGTAFKPVSSWKTYVDGAVTSGQTPPGRLDLSIGNGTSETTTVKFKPTATDFQLPPRLPVVADDTARTALVPSPTQGMMIFMQAGSSPAATNKVQAYDGSAWVNLH